MATTTAGTGTTTSAKKPMEDFEAFASFMLEQTNAAIKQGEEFLGIARKQVTSNIAHAQALALETLGKVRELTTDAVPALPEWLPVAGLGSATQFSFDVAEQVLAAERKVTANVLEMFTPASR